MNDNINPDLVKERNKCTFDVKELTRLIDGGDENTAARKNIEKMVFSLKGIKDEVPEEYMSHKEKYENSIRKACLVINLLREHPQGFKALASLDAFGSQSNTYRVMCGVTKDISPIMVHFGMFIPTIISQASQEQQDEWMPLALNMRIIGTYAQTELGHGSFIRGLETRATYDPDTEEFVLHSPTLTAFKWWPGGLAQTANHCIVIAQLYTQGKLRGLHSFFVQIRDLETHMPLPGIKVGEIGPKMGFNTANNGFLGFDNHRIPKKHMLMKNSHVEKDGTFVKTQDNILTYGTMVLVRVMLVTEIAYDISRAATIAVRYSAVRHQAQPKPGKPEPQILDYTTQQHKLFITIATSHAFRFTGTWLWQSYYKVIEDLGRGNLEQLPELHALACCLKAVGSKDGETCVNQCRLACGGHGYMTASNLPVIYGISNATVTYEGEYTVMLLQTARFLLKSWRRALESERITSTVTYFNDYLRNAGVKWENTPEGIIRGFRSVAAGKIEAANETILSYEKLGKDYEDAWNSASVQLVSASDAHCRVFVCDVYWTETLRLATELSGELALALRQLAELYLTYWALERSGDLFTFSNISKEDIPILRRRYEELLSLVRPNAVGLVDGYDICDEILNSTLGSYDGRVYERLMAEALKSPLNAQPVNDSFHKYLKPLMQSKL